MGYTLEPLPEGTGTQEILRSLRGLFQDPERWCRESWARDQEGRDCNPNDPNCCQWCLMGGFNRLTEDTLGWRAAMDLLFFAVLDLPEDVVKYSLISFNDDPRVRHEDLIWVLDRAVELAQRGLDG